MTSQSRWKWWVTGLLLFATMINYMDRQTLANLSSRITDEFHLVDEQYGNLELGFGWAFATGSLLFGMMADKVSVVWLYPAVLFAWSFAGFLTGFVRSYEELLACRTLLGFFEAGHWPCALIVTGRLLTPADRTLGNSVLQSGASIGAILTPLVIRLVCSYTAPGSWREPFFIVGATGTIWIGAWLLIMRGAIWPAVEPDQAAPLGMPIWEIFLSRRFIALLVMVACINTSWQLIRAWLPRFLQRGRDYSEESALYFNSVYYVATDIGCLAAGAATLALARRGLGVHSSRLAVFGCCALLAALTSVVAVLPAGWILLSVLLIVGAGSLGLFPCYYSFSQEISMLHRGKVTGILSTFAWVVSSPFQKLFGRLVDQRGSFDLVMALTGLPPLVALIVMAILWRERQPDGSESSC